MLTRCPACRTAFRVRPDQLALRHGRVRCGNCCQAFDALEALIDEVPSMPTTVSEPEPAPAEVPTPNTGTGAWFVLEDAAPSASQQLPLPDTEDVVPELYVEGLSRRGDALGAPDWSLPAGMASAASPAVPAPAEAEPTRAVSPTASDLDFVLPDESTLASAPPAASRAPEFYIGFEPPADASPAPAPALDIDLADLPPAQTQPAAAPLRVEPALNPFFEPAGSDSSIAEAARAATPTAAIAPPSRAAAEGASPTGEGAPEIYPFRIAPPPKPRRGLLGLGIGVMLMLLFVQTALLFRNAIIQILPESQPLYTELCARLGCELPLPREAGFIAIETSDLHPEAGRPDTFVLRSTILNRAPFVQAYPHLELTLTDARDAALSRRVLAPEEWLPRAAPAAAFAARSELEATLLFEAPGVKAVGYRVYAFYP